MIVIVMCIYSSYKAMSINPFSKLTVFTCLQFNLLDSHSPVLSK